MEFFLPRKYLVAIDQGWDDHDLMVYRGIWSKAELTVAVEDHGGEKRLFRTRCRIRTSLLSRVALLGFVGLMAVGWFVGALEITKLAALLGLINLGVVVHDNVRLGRIMCRVLEAVARHIELSPVDPASE